MAALHLGGVLEVLGMCIAGWEVLVQFRLLRACGTRLRSASLRGSADLSLSYISIISPIFDASSASALTMAHAAGSSACVISGRHLPPGCYEEVGPRSSREARTSSGLTISSAEMAHYGKQHCTE